MRSSTRVKTEDIILGGKEGPEWARSCKFCKHVYDDMWCARKSTDVDAVRGSLTLARCYGERDAGWLPARMNGSCGQEGRYFEDGGVLRKLREL